MKFPTYVICVLAIPMFAAFSAHVQKLKLDMEVVTNYQGKSVTVKGEVFYDRSGGRMVTHFTYPAEQVTITNNRGEFKSYDVETNSVVLKERHDLSSKTSFFYHFLSGQTNDMGLSDLRFRKSETTVDGNMVISEWTAIPGSGSVFDKAVLVHEDYLPIYQSFEKNGAELYKVYYSDYKSIDELKMPFRITEVEYNSPSDSVLVRKVYKNLRVNGEVTDKYLNFKIPSDAKVVTNTDQ